MTLLIGSEGSMGRRYQAILNHLNEPFEGIDINKFSKRDIKDFDRYIIATPTPTHYKWFFELDDLKKPMLIEKPFSKSLEEVTSMVNGRAPVSIMMQYRYLLDPTSIGPSWFDYYHHGKDGLIWDCFQIISLSQTTPDLAETSPVWSCAINGKRLNIADMDLAYVRAIKDFLAGKFIEPHLILKWHEKVKEFEDQWNIRRFQS